MSVDNEVRVSECCEQTFQVKCTLRCPAWDARFNRTVVEWGWELAYRVAGRVAIASEAPLGD